MKCIKTLETRSWINKSGNKDSARFGLFECPACSKTVELKLSKGKTQKSCGSAECKKVTRVHNQNSGHSGAKKHGYSGHKYYSTFKEAYRLLKARSDIELCEQWNASLKNFVTDMFMAYVKAKDTGLPVTFTYTGLVAEIATSKWESVKDFKVLDENMRKDTKTIANIVGTTNSIVKKTACKVFGEHIKKSEHTIVLHGKKRFPVEVYKLTDAQFTELKNVVAYNSSKATSNVVYMIGSGSFTKIGITANVDKRYQALAGSNPMPIKMIYNRNIGHGARALEAELHKKYSEQNLHHEWFALDDKQIEECIKYIEDYSKE